MFTLQLQCPKCGYHTPVGEDGWGEDVLYGDEFNSDWSSICTCHDCKTLFQRKKIDGVTIDNCRFCGSSNITVHERDGKPLVCPNCGYEKLDTDTDTMASYF